MTHRHLFISLLTFSFMVFPAAAHAQDLATPSASASAQPLPTEPIHITVSPPSLNLTTEPGASTSATIKIKNDSYTQTEYLRIDMMKFGPDITGSKPVLQDLTQGDIFPQWLNFSEPTFSIPPQTWKTLTVTFSPPLNASPAYYFALVFNRQSEPPPKPGAAAVHGTAAILVLVQVSSSRVYHRLDLAQLDSKTFGFKTDKYIYEFLPVNFTTSLANAGNVHELAFGNIFIDWVTGGKKDIEILDVNKERGLILPQSSRTFTNQWDNGFPHWEDLKDDAGNPILDKNGKTRSHLVWDLAKIPTFRIGKYRATLIMAYNDGIRDTPLEAQAEFWVIPWRILLALLVVVILIFIGVKGTLQSLWQKLKSLRQRQLSN